MVKRMLGIVGKPTKIKIEIDNHKSTICGGASSTQPTRASTSKIRTLRHECSLPLFWLDLGIKVPCSWRRVKVADLLNHYPTVPPLKGGGSLSLSIISKILLAVWLCGLCSTKF